MVVIHCVEINIVEIRAETNSWNLPYIEVFKIVLVEVVGIAINANYRPVYSRRDVSGHEFVDDVQDFVTT